MAVHGNLTVPSELNWVFIILAGGEWPPGREGDIWQIHEALLEAGDELDGVAEGVVLSLRDVMNHVDPTVGRAFWRYGEQLAEQPAFYATGARDLAEMARGYSLNVQGAKISMIVQLVFTAVEIIRMWLDPFEWPLIGPFIGMMQGVVRLIFQKFSEWIARALQMLVRTSSTFLGGKIVNLATVTAGIGKIISEMAGEAVEEGVEEVVQDAIVQVWQKLESDKKWEWDNTLVSFAFGAAAGAFAGMLGGSVAQFRPEWSHRWVTNALIEGSTEVFVGAITIPFGGDPGDIWKGTVNGLVSGAGTTALRNWKNSRDAKFKQDEPSEAGEIKIAPAVAGQDKYGGSQRKIGGNGADIDPVPAYGEAALADNDTAAMPPPYPPAATRTGTGTATESGTTTSGVAAGPANAPGRGGTGKGELPAFATGPAGVGKTGAGAPQPSATPASATASATALVRDTLGLIDEQGVLEARWPAQPATEMTSPETPASPMGGAGERVHTAETQREALAEQPPTAGHASATPVSPQAPAAPVSALSTPLSTATANAQFPGQEARPAPALPSGPPQKLDESTLPLTPPQVTPLVHGQMVPESENALPPSTTPTTSVTSTTGPNSTTQPNASTANLMTQSNVTQSNATLTHSATPLATTSTTGLHTTRNETSTTAPPLPAASLNRGYPAWNGDGQDEATQSQMYTEVAPPPEKVDSLKDGTGVAENVVSLAESRVGREVEVGAAVDSGAEIDNTAEDEGDLRGVDVTRTTTSPMTISRQFALSKLHDESDRVRALVRADNAIGKRKTRFALLAEAEKRLLLAGLQPLMRYHGANEDYSVAVRKRDQDRLLVAYELHKARLNADPYAPVDYTAVDHLVAELARNAPPWTLTMPLGAGTEIDQPVAGSSNPARTESNLEEDAPNDDAEDFYFQPPPEVGRRPGPQRARSYFDSERGVDAEQQGSAATLTTPPLAVSMDIDVDCETANQISVKFRRGSHALYGEQRSLLSRIARSAARAWASLGSEHRLKVVVTGFGNGKSGKNREESARNSGLRRAEHIVSQLDGEIARLVVQLPEFAGLLWTADIEFTAISRGLDPNRNENERRQVRIAFFLTSSESLVSQKFLTDGGPMSIAAHPDSREIDLTQRMTLGARDLELARWLSMSDPHEATAAARLELNRMLTRYAQLSSASAQSVITKESFMKMLRVNIRRIEGNIRLFESMRARSAVAWTRLRPVQAAALVAVERRCTTFLERDRQEVINRIRRDPGRSRTGSWTSRRCWPKFMRSCAMKCA